MRYPAQRCCGRPERSLCCWVVSRPCQHLPRQLDASCSCWVGWGGTDTRAGGGFCVSWQQEDPLFLVLGLGRGSLIWGELVSACRGPLHTISCPDDLHPLSQRELCPLPGIKRALPNPFSSALRAGSVGPVAAIAAVLRPLVLCVAAEEDAFCGVTLSSGWERFPGLALLLCCAPAACSTWAPGSFVHASPADKRIDLPAGWEVGASQQRLFISPLLIRYPKIISA